MTDWNGFRGAAKRIEDIDLPRIGEQIGVDEDEIHAFMDVEASGTGFDKLGRPKMLFEPHVFYRNLSGEERARAVREGLAYKSWKSGTYPADSYPRLERARAINETAALKAASWGLAQILGENHVAAGFDTVQDMVRTFMENEASHLQAAVNFIEAKGLDDELREHNWAGFARGYNGSGYKKNRYDEKLAKAYARWAKIPDTPYAPAPAPKPDATAKEIDNPATIKRIQQMLRDKGYVMVGRADGDIGPSTRSGIREFQAQNGLPITGLMTAALEAQIRDGKSRELAPARVNATKADIAAAPTVKTASGIQTGGIGAIVTGTVGAATAVTEILKGDPSLDQVMGAVGAAHSLYGTLLTVGPWVALAGVGLAGLFLGRHIIRDQLAKFRSGNHV